MVMTGTPPDSWLPVVSSVLSLVGHGGLGAVLLGTRRRLAARLFDDGELHFHISGEDVVRVGLVLLGVFFLTDAITASLPKLLAWSALPRQGLEYLLTQRVIPEVLGEVVQIGIGAALVVKSRPLAAHLWLGSGIVLSYDSTCPSCGAGYNRGDYRDDGVARCVKCGEQLHLDAS